MKGHPKSPIVVFLGLREASFGHVADRVDETAVLEMSKVSFFSVATSLSWFSIYKDCWGQFCAKNGYLLLIVGLLGPCGGHWSDTW